MHLLPARVAVEAGALEAGGMGEVDAGESGLAEEMGRVEDGRAGKDEIFERGIRLEFDRLEVGRRFGEPRCGLGILPFPEPVHRPVPGGLERLFALELSQRPGVPGFRAFAPERSGVFLVHALRPP